MFAVASGCIRCYGGGGVELGQTARQRCHWHASKPSPHDCNNETFGCILVHQNVVDHSNLRSAIVLGMDGPFPRFGLVYHEVLGKYYLVDTGAHEDLAFLTLG